MNRSSWKFYLGIMIIGLFLLHSFKVNGQDTLNMVVSDADAVEARVNQMKEELGLTSDQISDIRILLKQRRNSIKQIRNSKVRQDQRRSIVAVNARARKHLKETLTPDQFQRFVALRRDLKMQRDAHFRKTGREGHTPSDFDF